MDPVKYIELGAMGAIAGALIWLVRSMMSDHRAERTEWRDTTTQQFDRLDTAEEKRTARTEQAFEKLEQAIRDQRAMK